jgi:hypothetical protein
VPTLAALLPATVVAPLLLLWLAAASGWGLTPLWLGLLVISVAASATSMLTWQTQARSFVDDTSAVHQRWAPWVASASWFLPVAGWWLARGVLVDLWYGLDPATRATDIRRRSTPAPVAAWFGCAAAALFTAGLTFAVSTDRASQPVRILELLAILATAGSAYFLALVIRQLASWQAASVVDRSTRRDS